MKRLILLGVLGVLAISSSAALSQVVPNYDFDWATIGDPGNRAYPGDEFGQLAGRGSVDYEYRIGRTEVTTAQWMEYVNTFSTQSDELRSFGTPFAWGAVVDESYSGPRQRWVLSSSFGDAGRVGVFGITWRQAAEYVNWLDNNKSSDLSAIQNGAYDTSTFATLPDGSFTDQATHNPDAKFWIPTQDEWLKAAHYDPDKDGPGQGGWWEYSHASDDPPIPGPPGEGETSAGWRTDTLDALAILLGSYPKAASPWGLLDVTGGAQEWIEEIHGDFEFRSLEGTGAGSPFVWLDRAGFTQWERPAFLALLGGLRVVSVVPSPGSSALGLLVYALIVFRRKRKAGGSTP